MKHADFKLGTEFRLADKTYRCTDIGTRTIIAIRIDELTIQVRSFLNHTRGERILDYEEANKDGWFNGPPYSVLEHVFDEDSLPSCCPL